MAIPKKQRVRIPRRKPYLAEPFVNSVGQTINVGDAVVIVAGTKYTGISLGRYVGKRLQRQYNERTYKNGASVETGKVIYDYTTLVEEDAERKEWHANDGSGDVWDYSSKAPGLTDPGWNNPRPYPRQTWNYSTPPEQRKLAEEAYKKEVEEYKAAGDLVTKQRQEYYAANEAYKVANYHEVTIKYVVQRTLQLNRIFPADVKLVDVKGKI